MAFFGSSSSIRALPGRILSTGARHRPQQHHHQRLARYTVLSSSTALHTARSGSRIPLTTYTPPQYPLSRSCNPPGSHRRGMASSTNSNSGETAGPVESSMRSKLTEALSPSVLEIQNDSSKHSHHAPMRAIGGGSGETHFTVIVVSSEFKGVTSIKRHRMVNALLKEEFDQGLHALSLRLKTPEEWEKEGAGR